MLANEDILMISDLLDKKLKPIEVRFGQMQEHSDMMQGEMDMRFSQLQNQMDHLKLDMDLVKGVLKEHSDKLGLCSELLYKDY